MSLQRFYVSFDTILCQVRRFDVIAMLNSYHSYPHDRIFNLHLTAIQVSYCKDPKYLERRVCANSVDQIRLLPMKPKSRLIWGYTVCNSFCIFHMHQCMVKQHYSNFRIITAIFDVLIFRISQCNLLTDKWAASWQNQQNDCVPSEDSDQPVHPPSLIRVFAVRSMGS